MPAEIPGFEERIVEVRGGRVRSLVGGEGPPVVLVHGLTGAASNFVSLAPLLASRFRVLVPELPGHGGSPPLAAAPNLDALAEPVHAAASAEGMLPAVVVGHSLGGLVALRLAMRRPDAVRGLVLAGAAGIASATRWAEFWLSFFGRLQLGRRIAPQRGLYARRPRLRYVPFGYWGASDPQALDAGAGRRVPRGARAAHRHVERDGGARSRRSPPRPRARHRAGAGALGRTRPAGSDRRRVRVRATAAGTAPDDRGLRPSARRRAARRVRGRDRRRS